MLTDEQKNEIREFLERQGLSFKPLQDEMVDHISCDLEDRMREGFPFQEAWSQAMREIPSNHFQLIQKEIMETINKGVTWSQVLSFMALGMIFISTIFKMLHMNGADESLVLSLAFIAGSLLTGSLSGIFLNKGKKGATRMLAVIIGIILILIGFGFKFLHMRGGDQIILLAVVLLIISLVVNSRYVYKHASGEGNLLTYLHEKYTPGIERFFLFLLFPVVIYKVISILIPAHDFLGNLFLLIVIFGAGLQFITLTWRVMEKNLAKRNVLILWATVVCSLCLVLPFLGPLLPLPIRIILVALFSPVAGWLAYAMEDAPRKPVYLFLAGLVTASFLGWALIRFSIIPVSSSWIFFNIPVLLLLVAGVLICRKHGTMRAFMLVSVAGYLFEYIS